MTKDTTKKEKIYEWQKIQDLTKLKIYSKISQ
jgi:hypothetical protein